MILTLMIYPVNKRISPFIRDCKEYQTYNPLPVLSPKHGDVIEGSDLSILDGGDYANILMYRGFSEQLSNSDIIYFENCDSISDTTYKINIEEAKTLGKQLYFSRILIDRLSQHHWFEIDLTEDYNKITSKIIRDISIPIISIFTLGHSCDLTNVELTLLRYFQKKQYKVSLFGSDIHLKLIDEQPLPDFLYGNFNGLDKRIWFNNYLYDIANKNELDLIIVSIPDPIMKYNNKVLFGMGDIPCIIQDSIHSDIGIMCVYYNEYMYKYFEELGNFSNYRLNCESNYFNIANTKAIYNEEDEFNVDYLTLDNQSTLNNLEPSILNSEEFYVFNSFNCISRNLIFERIEEELKNNFDVIKGEL